MKDEEMAVEYADSIEEKKHWSDENDSNAVFTRQDVEQAFLAGLKEGRPQWHDLEKDPTDLPKGNNPVLVIIDYLALGKEYAIRENLKEDSKGIIAWCELPTFDKE